jgi:hypothetical protein
VLVDLEIYHILEIVVKLTVGWLAVITLSVKLYRVTANGVQKLLKYMLWHINLIVYQDLDLHHIV